MSDVNQNVRARWDAIATWWDQKVGEADLFHTHIIHPAVFELLALSSGVRVLDVACGNGNLARRMAALGASVVAIDFSEPLLERARARSVAAGDDVDYRRVDVTVRSELDQLGCFDAIVASMALHDIADIDPLFEALPALLAPHGRFVFSIPHPCFNTPRAIYYIEEELGQNRFRCGVKISDYAEPFVEEARAIRDQPQPQLVFHRPLEVLFGTATRAGLVLDALREPRPSAEVYASNPDKWARPYQLPAVLAGRWRVG